MLKTWTWADEHWILANAINIQFDYELPLTGPSTIQCKAWSSQYYHDDHHHLLLVFWFYYFKIVWTLKYQRFHWKLLDILSSFDVRFSCFRLKLLGFAGRKLWYWKWIYQPSKIDLRTSYLWTSYNWNSFLKTHTCDLYTKEPHTSESHI